MYAVGLSLLMLVPGTLVSTESVVGPLVRSRDFGSEDSLALVPWTLLVANAVWAAVGALAVPPLLAALDRRPVPPADRDPGEPGGTPMVLEVVDSEDRRHPAVPVPGDDGPVDPSVWSRRA